MAKLKPVRHVICGTPLSVARRPMTKSQNRVKMIRPAVLVCTKCRCAVPMEQIDPPGAVALVNPKEVDG